VPGVDFRVPSDLELDALLEFQLSLGRQQDLDLAALTFADPVVEFGKVMFQDQSATGGRCSLCHDNAGANRPPNNVPNAGRNTLANTRVELTAFTPAFLLQPDPEVVVVDGGFGKPPVESPTIPNRPGALAGFGSGQFDAPSVIEAAATPPFFHNNAVATLEAAIGFYCSPEFNVNPLAPIIVLNTDKAVSIAAFLRAVGTMELIDRAIENNTAAIDRNVLFGKPFISVGIANSGDALKVLKGGVFLLYPTVQQELAAAHALQEKALHTLNPNLRDAFLTAANNKLNQAKSSMIVP
jgi:hypothetical protein